MTEHILGRRDFVTPANNEFALIKIAKNSVEHTINDADTDVTTISSTTSSHTINCTDGTDTTELKVTPSGIIDDKGWEYYVDSTSIYPLVVNNARILVENDGSDVTITSNQPVVNGVATGMWDSSTSEFIPIKENDWYQMRLDIDATPATNNDNLEIQLDIGGVGPSNVIMTRLITFPRGGGVARATNVDMGVFTGATFVANNGKLYFDTTTDSSNVTVNSVGFFLRRVYTGK